MTATDLTSVLVEERRIMNLYAPDYDAAMLTNSYVYGLERAAFVGWLTAMLRREGRDPARLAVLDAGCASGNMVELLARAGFGRLTGMDLAEGMLGEACKRRLPSAGWVQATIEDAPFAPATFDVIVSVFTLHHLYEPSAFFRLVDRTLRPGGWFFVLEYDGSTMSGRADRPTRRALGDVVRGVFARKNRRAIDRRPNLPILANPAHRPLSFADIRGAIPTPASWDLRHESRGIVLPALLPVLVEESPFDRLIARVAGAADRRLSPRMRGLFQRIAGRRHP